MKRCLSRSQDLVNENNTARREVQLTRFVSIFVVKIFSTRHHPPDVKPPSFSVRYPRQFASSRGWRERKIWELDMPIGPSTSCHCRMPLSASCCGREGHTSPYTTRTTCTLARATKLRQRFTFFTQNSPANSLSEFLPGARIYRMQPWYPCHP